jgi:hypothetical protein
MVAAVAPRSLLAPVAGLPGENLPPSVGIRG